MIAHINNIARIKKLLAFIKARSAGSFTIDKELLAVLQKEVVEFAKHHRIKIRIVAPGEDRAVSFTLGGMIAGAVTGMRIAGLPGAAMGAAIGGVAGYACSHLILHIEPRDDGTYQVNLKTA